MDQVRWPKGPHTLKTCIKLNQNISLLTTNVQRVDNKVNKWRTYYAGRFIYKEITQEWLIITRKGTCNSTHQHKDRMTTIQYLDKKNKPEPDIQAQVQNRKEMGPEHIMAKELILDDE